MEARGYTYVTGKVPPPSPGPRAPFLLARGPGPPRETVELCVPHVTRWDGRTASRDPPLSAPPKDQPRHKQSPSHRNPSVKPRRSCGSSASVEHFHHLTVFRSSPPSLHGSHTRTRPTGEQLHLCLCESPTSADSVSFRRSRPPPALLPRTGGRCCWGRAPSGGSASSQGTAPPSSSRAAARPAGLHAPEESPSPRADVRISPECVAHGSVPTGWRRLVQNGIGRRGRRAA